jgi:ATP-binding cassette, subfamily F, member 3
MLTLNDIGIEFGGNWLLRNATYQFKPGERVGLIGRNGAGKSTLLKVIDGQITPSEGEVNKAGTVKIGFFNQDLLSYQTERSIFEVAREAYQPLLDLQAEIDELLHRMEAGDSTPEIWDDLATKQDIFEAQGGSTMDANVHNILSGLGFPAEEHDAPFKTFSGGWRMRVLLARMLLTEPDVLMLDEPTNHLDLPSIQWLEDYLKSFKGSTIVVSHDRYFIDRVANKIIEISLRQLHEYSGNYSFYLQEKEERMALHQRAYENQRKYIADQERFIERFKAKATKARQAQSKMKQLDKIERIEAPEEEVVDLSIRFSIRQQTGKEVLRLHDINKAYDQKVILRHTGATINRGDKIALIGANGLGKSTLLRILANREPFNGQREEGYHVHPSFFAQHQLEALTLKNTILQEAEQSIADKTEQQIRTILGCFMFTGEEVDKKIQVLSGGEKSRVALAKTLMSEANFLLLDEPTNHLDIPSIQILVEALNAYEGTYVIVSHDRYFLQKVANKIWYIENHQIKEYPGTYDEWADWYAKKEEQEKTAVRGQTTSLSEASRQNGKEKSSPAGNGRNPQPSTSNSELSPLNFAEQKQLKNRHKKLDRERQNLEKRIEKLEAKLAELETQMADPAVAANFGQLSGLQNEHDTLIKTIEQTTKQWEAALLELEEITKHQ